MLWSESTFYCF